MKQQGVTRRAFLASSALAGFYVAADKVYGADIKKEEQKLRFLKVGCGGMGGADLNSLTANGAVCVGMCDTNADTLAGQAKKFNVGADRCFTDYRQMFAKIPENSYDAVCVSTTDHTHATIALEGMRRHKHVYVQKPLAHSYEECEMLIEAAEKYKVVTQMGNQGHPGVYRYEKLLQNNFWGDILEVHSWTDRCIPGSWWAQGMTSLPEKKDIPKNLNWDCWLGPAKYRDFGEGYQPFRWRGWLDFGCGAIGDMAVHNFDPGFWVLQLGLPLSIKAWCDAPAKIAFPKFSTIDFRFGPSPVCPKGVSVYWYESGILPKRPLGAHPQLNLGSNGLMIVGTKATTLGASHASKPSCVAVTGKPFGAETKEAEHACNDLLKEDGASKWNYNHYKQWVEACKADKPEACGSKFSYAARLTEALLFGCLAQRFPGVELTWDPAKKEFNKPEATALLKGEKRAGFEPRV